MTLCFGHEQVVLDHTFVVYKLPSSCVCGLYLCSSFLSQMNGNNRLKELEDKLKKLEQLTVSVI